ncbi:MAG: YqjF family protein [Planctomycetaceae bacterium]
MPRLEPSLEERIAATRRPAGRLAGYQCWNQLLFLHWRVPAALVAPLLPAELTLDTWEGDAWVGLIPFSMAGVRPWWAPPVPGISNFLETNVRTYVHRQGRDPGVWFFSLEAANSLAVRLARWGWHLPYHRAAMTHNACGPLHSWSSQRQWPGTPGVGCDIEAEFGEPLFAGSRAGSPGRGHAPPGTFEYFLAERYLLFSRAPGPQGTLWRGQVWHTPYPLISASLRKCRQDLLPAAGLPIDRPPDHVAASPGVNVEIFPLAPVV